MRCVLPSALLKIDTEDHLTAALVGSQGFEELLASVEHADAGGPAHLVPGQDQEIAADLLDVHSPMASALGGVDQCGDAQLAGTGAEFGDWVDGAERVGNVGEGEKLNFVSQPFAEPGQIQEA